MKYKVSKKTMKQAYGKYILCVGFCNLQNLLNGKEPNAYSTRVEGWACDWYEFPGFVVSTGYAPEGKAWLSYAEQREWDQAAERILCDRNYSWEENAKRLENLRADFVGTVKEKMGIA